MHSGTTFDSTKELLPEILKEIKNGKIQLPDFQRGWIWDDNHVKSLLASISVSYPIGAVMMLATGNPDVRFRPRPVEGVDFLPTVDPEWLILDGQQRLTSLYQALALGKPVKTRDSRGNDIERWYYLSIPASLDPDGDQEEAIVSIPGDRLVRNFRGETEQDLRSTELECAADLFPLRLVFDFAELMKWQSIYTGMGGEKLNWWLQFGQQVIPRIQSYQVPLIKLFKETPKEAVCQVFEKVNTGGVSLTVFELLTATFAADDFNLRDDWSERKKALKKSKVLSSVQNDDFLQAVSLLASRERRKNGIAAGLEGKKIPAITCKRKDVLRLSLDEYRSWADPVLKGFKTAARFMHAQRIYDARDLPYRTQLVPLAAICSVLGDKYENDSAKRKIARWFWCGVFGELYGGATETRFSKDLPEVLAWIEGGDEPDTVKDAHFSPGRLESLRTRNSAAYKGLFALLIKDGGLDFRTGDEITLQLYFDDKIDIHHIFPQAYCREKGIDPKHCDCVINKTGISARTNRIIGKKAPSDYLARLQKSTGIRTERMHAILRSHVIDPEAIERDDFDTFFRKRRDALLRRIETAMGKPILEGPEEPNGIKPEPLEFQLSDEETE